MLISSIPCAVIALHVALLLLRDKSKLCHLLIDFIEDIEIDYPHDDYKRELRSHVHFVSFGNEHLPEWPRIRVGAVVSQVGPHRTACRWFYNRTCSVLGV